MSVVFRLVRASDVDRLVEIERSAFSGDRLSRRALRWLSASPSAAMIVAECTGSVVGYAVALFRSASRVARLYSIASDRPGIGRALLQAVEAAAINRGRTAMRLEVRADNSRAIGLYEKAGYRRFGERPGYYDDGMSALRMQKDFAPLSSEGGL